MKKLMIAAAIVCAAALSQAASVTWKSSSYAALPSGACTTGKALGNGDLKMIVWEFSAAQWTALEGKYTNVDNIYTDYAAGTLKIADAAGTSAPATGMTKASVSSKENWTEGDTVYAAVLFLHDDTKKFTGAENYYMGNYASAEATEAGGAVLNLGTKIGGSGAATTWQSVPEPTSGLLLLLGVAGLALRRRRA